MEEPGKKPPPVRARATYSTQPPLTNSYDGPARPGVMPARTATHRSTHGCRSSQPERMHCPPATHGTTPPGCSAQQGSEPRVGTAGGATYAGGRAWAGRRVFSLSYGAVYILLRAPAGRSADMFTRCFGRARWSCRWRTNDRSTAACMVVAGTAAACAVRGVQCLAGS